MSTSPFSNGCNNIYLMDATYQSYGEFAQVCLKQITYKWFLAFFFLAVLVSLKKTSSVISITTWSHCFGCIYRDCGLFRWDVPHLNNWTANVYEAPNCGTLCYTTGMVDTKIPILQWNLPYGVVTRTRWVSDVFKVVKIVDGP